MQYPRARHVRGVRPLVRSVLGTPVRSLSASSLSASSLSASSLSASSLSASSLSASSLSASALSASALSASALSAHALSAHALSAHALSAHALSASALSAHNLSAHALSAHNLSAQALSAQALSAHNLSAHALSAHALSAHALSAHALSAPDLSARARLLSAVSARVTSVPVLSVRAPTVRALSMFAVLALGGGCRIGFDDVSRDGPVADGVPGDGTSSGCDLTKDFGPPALIAELDTSSNDEGTLRLFADELTGYYWATKAGVTDIYFAQRANLSAPFTTTSVDDLNTTMRQLDPTVSSDGTLIVFRRNVGGDHLYMATRTGPTAFGAASQVAMVDTGSDQQPYLRPDSNELYFSSARQGAMTGDLYRTTHNGTTFEQPTHIDELAIKDTRAGDPVVTADGLTIFFRSDRPGSAAGFNIWVAHRTSTALPFETPTEVSELTSSSDEGPSDISRDGCRLYLSSNRAGTNDIYVATRLPP